MHALMAVSLLCLAPGLAAAEDLKVRAGEHGDFSRIVIPVSGGTPLVMSSGHDLRVVIDGASAADLSEIDERRAARVASARQSVEDGKLTLAFALDCACEPALSAGADGELVLDIRNKAETAEAPAPLPKADAGESEAERARERLRQAIAGASSSGVVRLKTEVDGPAAGEPTLLTDTKPMPPSSGESALVKPDCSLEDDLLGGVADGESETRTADDLALTYLKLGFFAESFAVARTDEASARMRILAAVAGALDGRRQELSTELTGHAACGPSHRLLAAAVRAIESPAAPLDLVGDERGVLGRLAPELRFALAESLAHAAHEQGDHATARDLVNIARAAVPARASVKLDIIDAIADRSGEGMQERLARAARQPGPQQLRALDALGEASVPRDRIADLRMAARLSPSDEARLDAARKAADLLEAGGDIIEAVEIYAEGRWPSEALASIARESAAALLARSAERHVVSAAAAFLAYEKFLSVSDQSATLRVTLARELAPLGDARVAQELLADPRIPAAERARIVEETNGEARPRAAAPPQLAAFSNERLSLSARDPEGAVRAAQKLEKEAAAMREILEEGKSP